MAETNGDFSDEFETPKSDSKPSTAFKVRIDGLEQENRQLVRDKNVIQKRVAELKQTIEEAGIEKEKLFSELQESKAEIRALKSVAARAAELEGEVSRLQHELVGTTSALEEVNKELTDVKFTLDGFRKIENDKGKEFEAVVVERNLLVEKLGVLEAKENRYLNEMNEKEKEIVNLRMRIVEVVAEAGKSGDDKEVIDKLKRELEMTVGELERKLEDKERVIKGFEKERGTIGALGKMRGLMAGEVKLGWPEIAASVACAVGFGGLVCYLRQGKRA